MWLLPLFLHTTIFRIKLAASAIQKKFRKEEDSPAILLCMTDRLAVSCVGALTAAGWACHRVPSLRYVDRAARVLGPRAIITDRMTPANERPFGPVPTTLPIVFVGRPRRERCALQAGAALFIPVPIDVPVLIQGLSRIRLSPSAPDSEIAADPNGLWLDPNTAQARVGMTPLILSRRHFGVLYELARNPGKLLTTERLCSGLIGIDPMTPGALMTCIWRLRRILCAAGAPDCIETVHHLGYRYALLTPRISSGGLAAAPAVLRHK